MHAHTMQGCLKSLNLPSQHNPHQQMVQQPQFHLQSSSHHNLPYYYLLAASIVICQQRVCLMPQLPMPMNNTGSLSRQLNSTTAASLWQTLVYVNEQMENCVVRYSLRSTTLPLELRHLSFPMNSQILFFWVQCLQDKQYKDHMEKLPWVQQYSECNIR